MMHEEKLSGDESEVGQGAVPQHQQHLIGRQPAAGGVAPAPPGETQSHRLASNANKICQARIGMLTVVVLGVEIMAGGWRRCGVGTVDDDARGSKQEVVQQLLNQRRS